MPVWFPRKNELEPPGYVEALPALPSSTAKVERSPRRLLNALVLQLRDGFAA
jgi:hypothetical protein